MRMLLSQEFKVVRREVDQDEAATRLQDAKSPRSKQPSGYPGSAAPGE